MGHHYVPQRYLRNFEDLMRPGTIWSYDRRSGPPRNIPIKNAAQSPKFYGAEVESLLANEVEAPANRVLDKLLRRQRIGQRDRARLSLYLGSMIYRVPRNRREVAAIFPEVRDHYFSTLRAELDAAACDGSANPERLVWRSREIDRIQLAYSRQIPIDLAEKINSPLPGPGVLSALNAMTWRVLIAAGSSYFVTSDNPAFFFRSEYGLGSRDSEISFPLSSEFALHGSFRSAVDDPAYLCAGPDLVRVINRRSIRDAERFVFSHEPGRWIGQLFEGDSMPLDRIGW